MSNLSMQLSSGPVPQGAKVEDVAGTLINMSLVPLPQSQPSTQVKTPAVKSNQLATNYQNYKTTKITTEDVQIETPVICWDCETTGTNPWDYSWLVASFWNLQEKKSDMVTFADWDEEALTREVAEYLNSLGDFNLTGFNIAFDQRCCVSRFMAYQIPVNQFLTCAYYDTRDFMKKGTWKSLFSDQPSGTLEDWIKWLYDEPKPYTIEECFAAVKNEDLEPFIVRNRWDVATEGDLYLLTRFIETSEERGYYQLKPTMYQREEEIKEGNVVVSCPVCKTLNEFELKNDSQTCYVCASKIDRPLAKDYLQEVMREIVIPKEDTKKKTSTSKKS